MKRKYEGLIVLNTRGVAEPVEAVVSRIGRDMELEGATLEQIDHIGKRRFPYGSKKLDEGYYVNYFIQADTETLEKLRGKLRLTPEVHQQHFQRLS